MGILHDHRDHQHDIRFTQRADRAPRHAPKRTGFLAHRTEEYDGSNAWQAHYTYEDGWDHPRSMDRADVADVDADSNATEVLRFSYSQSALGHVSEVSSPSGAVVEWCTYSVFGETQIRDLSGTVVPDSAILSPVGFAGRLYDSESATYDFRARTYDPVCGRFVARDPLGFVDGPNQYQYCLSSPADATDPTGTETGKAKAARLKFEAAQSKAEKAVAKAEEARAVANAIAAAIAATQYALGMQLWLYSVIDVCARPTILGNIKDLLDQLAALLAAFAAADAAASKAEAAAEDAVCEMLNLLMNYIVEVIKDLADNGLGGLPPGRYDFYQFFDVVERGFIFGEKRDEYLALIDITVAVSDDGNGAWDVEVAAEYRLDTGSVTPEDRRAIEAGAPIPTPGGVAAILARVAHAILSKPRIVQLLAQWRSYSAAMGAHVARIPVANRLGALGSIADTMIRHINKWSPAMDGGGSSVLKEIRNMRGEIRALLDLMSGRGLR